MQARYLTHAAFLKGGDDESHSVRAELTGGWTDGVFEQVVEGFEPVYGRFDPGRPRLRRMPGSTTTRATTSRAGVYDMVGTDLDEALAIGGSPVKAALEVIRILRDQLRSVIEFGGLTLESYIDFQATIRGRINRLEAGPPPFRSQAAAGSAGCRTRAGPVRTRTPR